MTAAPTDRKFANTLARGLGLLQAFRASDDGLTNAEIAERTGLPKPTVTRLSYTLCALGYLSHGARNDRFRLGPAAVALGSVASLSVSFLDLASNTLQRLANQTGTLALVAVRDGDRMLLIWLDPGHRIPIYGSSSGLAVLATLGDDRFAALEPDEALTRYRQDGYDQLIGQGFAIAPQPTRYAGTVNAVSVPYYASEFGESVAFTCGALPQNLPDERMMAEVDPALRAAVRSFEKRIGLRTALARRG